MCQVITRQMPYDKINHQLQNLSNSFISKKSLLKTHKILVLLFFSVQISRDVQVASKVSPILLLSFAPHIVVQTVLPAANNHSLSKKGFATELLKTREKERGERERERIKQYSIAVWRNQWSYDSLRTVCS